MSSDVANADSDSSPSLTHTRRYEITVDKEDQNYEEEILLSNTSNCNVATQPSVSMDNSNEFYNEVSMVLKLLRIRLNLRKKF